MPFVTNDWKIDILIAISTLCILLYYKIKSIYSYFEKRNIKYVKPTFLLGSDPNAALLKTHITESWDKIYKILENEKYGGFYQALVPTLMIKDPEYINNILKTSFDHFHSRGFLVDEKRNPLDQNLFFIGGNKWRYLRTTMSPLFSQVKLKWMYEGIEKCADIFDECIAELSDERDVDMKELLARYTTDIISSCGFGVEPQSLKDPNSEFRQIGKDIVDPNKTNMFLMLLRFSIPRIIHWLKIKTATTKVEDFFLTTTKNMLHHRRSTGIERKDFVQLFLELKEKGTVEIDSDNIEKNETHKESSSEKIELSDDLLAAQAFVFFLAGYETTSTTLYFTFYLLAKHKEIQDRARKEVLEVKAKYGKFTFDSLKELKFLNDCVAETLRLYPAAPMIIRECMKDHTLPDGTLIEKGLNVVVPIYSIHRDPKYFPEPMKYNPDRFKEPPANGTYLPFGDGPRICIGKRLAEAVITTTLARSLEKYEFKISPMDKGDDDIKFHPKVLIIHSARKLLLRIHKINTKLSDDLLAAQSFVFFFAGFETTSTTLYFTFYLLAKNKEIQDRARKEIPEVKAKYGGFPFDSLKELKFLNYCIAGKRFGEAVMSCILARTLKKYEFRMSPLDKCGDDIKFNPKVIITNPLQGLFIRIHKLNTNK